MVNTTLMNSKLFFHDNGHIRARDVLPLNGSTRVCFDVPPQVERAELFIAAQQEAESSPTLKACCGDAEYSFAAPKAGCALWLRAPMQHAGLGAGEIEIEIPMQNGWSLARDVQGASVVRLRVGGEGLGDDRVLPVYGDAELFARRDQWLALLPESLQTLKTRWDWCWDLAGWLSSSWPYANEFEASSYAPWDARTILKWGRAGKDDNGEKPIVMCVHYAVCFIQFCIAMNIPARAIVLSPDLYSSNGHFVAEVWLEEFQSWAMIDPNLHLCFRDGNTQRPLAVGELHERREELNALAHCGETFASLEDRLQNFGREWCFSGEVYRLWGAWARHDWIENRQFAPPSHGAVLYAETDILWSTPDGRATSELAMFPHFLSPQQLTQAP